MVIQQRGTPHPSFFYWAWRLRPGATILETIFSLDKKNIKKHKIMLDKIILIAYTCIVKEKEVNIMKNFLNNFCTSTNTFENALDVIIFMLGVLFVPMVITGGIYVITHIVMWLYAFTALVALFTFVALVGTGAIVVHHFLS